MTSGADLILLALHRHRLPTSLQAVKDSKIFWIFFFIPVIPFLTLILLPFYGYRQWIFEIDTNNHLDNKLDKGEMCFKNMFFYITFRIYAGWRLEQENKEWACVESLKVLWSLNHLSTKVSILPSLFKRTQLCILLKINKISSST